MNNFFENFIWTIIGAIFGVIMGVIGEKVVGKADISMKRCKSNK